MKKIYMTEAGRMRELAASETGCWIALTNPTDDEIEEVSLQYELDKDVLRAALDMDERSRIETDDNYTMVLVNIPTVEPHTERELYTTIPLSVIVMKECVITVCMEDTAILRQLTLGRIRDFNTALRSRFVLQVMYNTASNYLFYLRLIEKKSDEVENKMHRSQENRELIELLKIQKSLLYFTTALRSNEAVLEKLFKNDNIKRYPDDADLLEDVIVENKQAIEMANIYSGILSGMMDVFASIISNNLNIVMKVLAIITVVMSIPTMVFSAYGMNVASTGMPFSQNPYGFWMIIFGSLLVSLIVALVFTKMKMFK